MSQTAPGWYDDPYPSAYGPGGLRWWDGQQWSPHTAARPQHGGYAGPAQPTTPDGEPLAGWGRRLGAYLIDGLILVVASLVVGSPFLGRIVGVYSDYFRETLDASRTGGTPPGQLSVYGDAMLPLLGLGLVSLGLNLVYQVGFLRWRAATPGKLLLGLRVRLREQPGPLAWGTVLRRWAGQFGPSVLGLVPFVGSVSSIYTLVDGLWPLWDADRQAIHDKVAHTNVVRARR